MRTHFKGLTIVLFTVVCSLSVQAQIEDEAQPYWPESSAYTAELDLSSQTLRVMPMDGPEMTFDLSHSCTLKQDLDEGVYALVGEGDARALYASYPENGKVAFDQGNVSLASCELGRDQQALRLPANAMSAMNDANVGAIYVHP